MTGGVSAFYNCLWLLGSWATVQSASVRVAWKLEEAVNFESAQKCAFPRGKLPLGSLCENKGLTSLANVSAPSEFGVVSGEFLTPRLLCCLSCPASWDSWNWVLQTHFLSPSFIMCLWFYDAGSEEWGPGRGGDLTCLLAVGSISGSCSQREDAASQCDLLWRNLVKSFL